MSNQIFKDKIPNEILFNFLDETSTKNEKFYTFDGIAFKKGEYNNSITKLCDTLQPYYHKSKEFYVTRKITYSKLTTIIRQICKKNHILFTSKIKYDKSKYNILYFIYY